MTKEDKEAMEQTVIPEAVFKGETIKERLDCHKDVRISWKKDVKSDMKRLECSFGKTHNCQRTMLNGIQNLVNLCMEYKIAEKDVSKCLRGIFCKEVRPGSSSCPDLIGRVIDGDQPSEINH